MPINEKIFKAYDIRGVYPTEIDEEGTYGIAQAYANLVNPKTVVLGRDERKSSQALFDAARQGLVDHGVNVVDVGVISTDMLYFAVANYGYDGGITISASHDPAEYNGMKLVREQSIPISGDSGIAEIKQMVKSGYEYKANASGEVTAKDIVDDYIKKCLSVVDVSKIKPLKVVANGMFGLAVQMLERMRLPIVLIKINDVPDGSFPKGQPDPSQEQNVKETEQLIRDQKADLGAAWDGDADRMFIFDELGREIPAYYLTAFLASHFCNKIPSAKIIHEPRLAWAIEDAVKKAGGIAILNKAGHSFIKSRMRGEDAVFAGESSGHYYFKDYFYCDNGLIPFLLMLQIVSESGKKVSELFDEYFENYPTSGEINTKVADQAQVKPLLEKLEQYFAQDKDANLDKTDGITIEYPTWRANVRGSNTEPLIRVNVEARNGKILDRGVEEVLKFIG